MTKAAYPKERRLSRIPFGKPFIVGKELYYIAQAVISGSIAGNGIYTKKCQQWFETKLGCSKSLLTHSCTAALEMATILCDIGPGDEVIMPSFTFVSTANAVVLRGGTPVFVDIDEETLNIDETLIEQAITEKTKAIYVVHYAGHPCNMERIMEIARRHKVFVVEDAAHALLSKDGDRYLGTIGDLGCLSFHETKNIISGEGGALLINNEDFKARAEIIWEKGTNRSSFFRGEVDKYTWVDVGSSYLPSELTSAFLFAQLENSQTINQRRKAACQLYRDKLKRLSETGKIRIPASEYFDESNGHLFYLIARSEQERNELIEHLQSKSIHATFHYIPLHTSPAGQRYGRGHGTLKVTDDIHQRLLRLPLYFELDDSDIHRITDEIEAFYHSK